MSLSKLMFEVILLCLSIVIAYHLINDVVNYNELIGDMFFASLGALYIGLSCLKKKGVR